MWEVWQCFVWNKGLGRFFFFFFLRQSEDLLVLHFLSSEHDFVSIKITKILKWAETTLEMKYDESEFCPPVTHLWFRVHLYSKQKPIFYCGIYFFNFWNKNAANISIKCLHKQERSWGIVCCDLAYSKITGGKII